MRPTRATLIVAAAFVPSVLAAQSDAAARAGVEHTNRGFISAFKAGDAAAATPLYAPNAIVVEPDGARYEGRAKIGALLKQYTSLFDFSAFEITIESFGSGGNVAWAGGKEIATLVDKKTKKSTSETDTYLAVYDRQADGTWLMRYLQQTKIPEPGAK
jgi:ketosteroid isomerase-like protein